VVLDAGAGGEREKGGRRANVRASGLDRIAEVCVAEGWGWGYRVSHERAIRHVSGLN
jgi:hypothetical protein